MNSFRTQGAVALVVAAVFAATTVAMPTRAHAGNYGGALAAGIIGGAVLGIIASQAAKANRAPAVSHHRTRKAKAKAPAPAKQEAQVQTQAQVVRQSPPPMTSDPFKGVAPAAVPASSVSPTSF
ncbi:MAG: hypothetical protein GC182_11965 [Rhodopseudomonas sp.]|nr:hypothetical protein [Rhodopseudomonas sp.]